MKGQHLYVRMTTPDDADAIARFHVREGRAVPGVRSDQGFIAKLAGDVVAHALTMRDQADLDLVFFYVGEPYRRKRVGRRFVDQILCIAGEQGTVRLHVDPACQLSDFFSSVGFAPSPSGLERVVE